EYLPEKRRLRAHAFWLNGAFLESYEQPIEGTPCAAVVQERRLLHIYSGMGELYPDAPDVRALGVVSYLGVPLFALDGSVMGHLAVLDTKPLPSEPRLISLF